MTRLTPPTRSPAPLPAVTEAIRERLSGRDLQAVESIVTLRATAQQVENTVTEWFAGTVGSPARFEILILLSSAEGRLVPHKDIVAATGVTKATISGLMMALEREGLVKSAEDRTDRRRLLATLTPKGKAFIAKANATNTTKLRVVLASFSTDKLMTLTALLHRLRETFTADLDDDVI